MLLFWFNLRESINKLNTVAQWWIWNQKHWSYHCFISEFFGSMRQIKGRWNILNANEIIQYIFHQKRASYIFLFTFNGHLFMCCSGFLWILNNLRIKSILQSSEFLIFRKCSLYHLPKIPRIGHLNMSSLINSFFQTDL